MQDSKTNRKTNSGLVEAIAIAIVGVRLVCDGLQWY